MAEYDDQQDDDWKWPEAKVSPLMENRWREKFEKGDDMVLLEALIAYTANNEPLPGWLSGGLFGCLLAWNSYEVKTLDEAFGVYGRKRQDAGRNDAIQLRVYFAVWVEHTQNNKPLTEDGAFTIVAEKLDKPGLGPKKVRDIYYQVKKILPQVTDICPSEFKKDSDNE